jgi:hypothetical protein
MSSLTDKQQESSVPPESAEKKTCGDTPGAFKHAENLLVPWAETKANYESLPRPKCLGKHSSDAADDARLLWKPSLEVIAYSHGALSDIVITCKVCQYEKVVCSSTINTANNCDDSSGSLRSTRSTNSTPYKA